MWDCRLQKQKRFAYKQSLHSEFFSRMPHAENLLKTTTADVSFTGK